MGVVINVKGLAQYKPGNARCPHLSFKGTKAQCTVHNEEFFKSSPCHTYGNGTIDPDFYAKKGKPCPIGKLIQDKGGLFVVHGAKYGKILNAGDLEYLGPWSKATG